MKTRKGDYINMNDNKVSVIVPIYNVESYLKQCIDSIINQSYQNIEIILVDDGSTDNSGRIADEYSKKDKRIKVIHKYNEGVSSARNTGIEVATGEYICFSDADDYLMNDYVEYLLNLITQNDADVSLTKEMFTTFHKNQIEHDKIEEYSAEKVTKEILIYNIPIGVYCKMFKRSFLNKNNIRFISNIFIGEGFNFNTAAFQRANKVVVGNKKIYFYRRNNPTSATTKFSMNKWENALYAIQNIKNDLIIKSNDIITAWNYANWHTYCDTFNFMVMASAEKEYSNMYKKCLKILRQQAYYSFLLPIKFREKIRAIVIMIYPRFIPKLINLRNKKYIKD